MAGVAVLAKQRGDKVTGIDANVYPPMSTYLESQGIEIKKGYDEKKLEPNADDIVVGNVMSRGNPVLEAVLREDLNYISGPAWLSQNIMKDKWRIVVTGTHGKTTTTAMVTWILEYAGLNPGFLVGGIPENFGVSARYTDGKHFVVEGDEYDTAFCDKRSKFVHYRPKTLICNNLEYDHADIFPDMASIQRQFNHVVKMVPDNGLAIHNTSSPYLNEVMDQAAASPLESFGNTESDWQYHAVESDCSVFDVIYKGKKQGTVKWSQLGAHNANNALAAIAAAHHAGVSIDQAIKGLGEFKGVKRRLQLRGESNGVKVYDDFAHHPTEIKTTLQGVKASAKGRVIAVLEPRSNTMKRGEHKSTLADAVSVADLAFFYEPPNLPWSIAETMSAATIPVEVKKEVSEIVEQISKIAKADDKIVVMSNGAFEDIHERLLAACG